MTSATRPRSEQQLIELAQHGDRAAFDELMTPLLAGLRQLLRRMVGDPHDADDLLQDVLIRAHTRLGTFRGEAKLTTWLYTIATRLAIDHLGSRRLRADAQLRLRDHVHADPRHSAELERMLGSETARFDAREHIAFCFSCVARSLSPEEQAALVLRDVLELSNDEAARALELSTSVLRHRLSAARTTMQERYDDLCRLVSKTGVCYQCEGLRASFPVAGRGPEVPVLRQADDDPEHAYRRRLTVVRSTDPDQGVAHHFHDFLWRALATLDTTLDTTLDGT